MLFPDGYIVKHITYTSFQNGLKSLSEKRHRIGTSILNSQECKMKIIDYIDSRHCTIQFEDGTKLNDITYSNFIKGAVINYNIKTLYNHGFIGYGKYNSKHNSYSYWCNMLNRCYNSNYLETRPTYKDCVVCDEWLNFQNFAEWYDENFYQINNEKMHLDKDILHKRNKVYSPQNCVFVTDKINSLFTKCNKNRGDCCIGVTKINNKYIATLSKYGNGNIYLGNYNNQIDAFNVYKIEKEKYIKQIANKYQQYIPKILYNAMINYKVEISD